jgi:hypothetical protein
LKNRSMEAVIVKVGKGLGFILPDELVVGR